jgi:hypothetical protein
MKEAIISILIEHDLDFDKTPFYHSAKEIAEMMTAFIKWKDEHIVYRDDNNYWRIIETPESIQGDFKISQLTLKDVWDYWVTEIYKKQK